MNLLRYQVTLILQILLLLVDIFANTFSDFLGTANVNLLVIYVLQDLFIIFTIIVAFLQFFNTYIFQAGLAGLLLSKFKATIFTAIIYLILCVSLQGWGLSSRWSNVNSLPNTGGYIALYVIQRTWAVIYYYFYKRTALRLGDERFYRESDWLRKEFDKRR